MSRELQMMAAIDKIMADEDDKTVALVTEWFVKKYVPTPGDFPP